MPYQHPKSPFFRPHDPRASVVVARYGTVDPVAPAQREEPVEAKSGLFGCTCNMMTCIVGSGIVGKPHK